MNRLLLRRRRIDASSMATLIGLCIRVKLLRSLPPRFKVAVEIAPGTHSSEAASKSQPSLAVMEITNFLVTDSSLVFI